MEDHAIPSIGIVQHRIDSILQNRVPFGPLSPLQHEYRPQYLCYTKLSVVFLPYPSLFYYGEEHDYCLYLSFPVNQH